MSNLTIVGSQWGDEGKGKFVDLFAEHADVIVRFQGGHNAGHTIKTGNKTFKLSLLPSGIIRGDKTVVIGNGVVIDPYKLIEEIEKFTNHGINITPANLKIADNAPLILSIHRELDSWRESASDGLKIGTLKLGIGPSYEDKVGRRAIRVVDLVNNQDLENKVTRLLVHHNALRRGLGIAEVTPATIINELQAIAAKIKPFATQVWDFINQCQQQKKRILFEGAQGTFLDDDHGTYPFVTSSNTVAAAAACGCGCGPQALGKIIGVTKAYTTRVGQGPFPTELDDEIGDMLGRNGEEFGTVSNRKRRCGWLDIAMLKQAVKVNGIDYIALTKIDVLDELESIKLGVGYNIEDKFYDYLPCGQSDQALASPVYETIDGWQQSTYGIRSIEKLPAKAINYVKKIEQMTGVPIIAVSTGPERRDTIMLNDFLTSN